MLRGQFCSLRLEAWGAMDVILGGTVGGGSLLYLGQGRSHHGHALKGQSLVEGRGEGERVPVLECWIE